MDGPLLLILIVKIPYNTIQFISKQQLYFHEMNKNVFFIGVQYFNITCSQNKYPGIMECGKGLCGERQLLWDLQALAKRLVASLFHPRLSVGLFHSLYSCKAGLFPVSFCFPESTWNHSHTPHPLLLYPSHFYAELPIHGTCQHRPVSQLSLPLYLESFRTVFIILRCSHGAHQNGGK